MLKKVSNIPFKGTKEQEEKLNLMLAERRTRFLRLCDDMPPPSLQLNRIADHRDLSP